MLSNLTNTAYAVGSPEVGTYFVAPNSGRVRMIIGGGSRDGPTGGTDRVFISPQVFLGSALGSEFLAPTIDRGVGSDESSTEFQYGSRVTMLSGLTPGKIYYARTVYAIAGPLADASADVASRDITIIPLP